jgi:hypothetical protein
MGTPASGTVELTFNKKSTAEKILAWVKKANEGKLKGDFEITLDTDNRDEGFMSFDLDSQRVQNLEWQIDQFHDFAEKIEDIRSFNSNISVITSGPFFDKDS